MLQMFRDADYNYQGIGFCVVSIMIFCHSLINSFLLYYVKEIISKLYAALVNCSFCLLVSYLIIFKIVSFIILLESFDASTLINNIKEIIELPMVIGLLSLSIILLIGIFKLAPQQIESDLQRLKQIKQPSKEIKDNYINYSWESQIKNKFKKAKLQYMSPILVSICYLVLEFYCYGKLIWEMSQSKIDYQMIITYSGLLAAIPIFFIFGILIANSNMLIGTLYLRIPLFIGGVLTFITVKIWTLTSQNQYMKEISSLIHICSLIISVIWLTVGYFRSERRNQKMFAMLIACYFFAFPLGFLLTLSDGFQDFQITISVIILLSVGSLPLIILIIYYATVVIIYLKKLPQQAETASFQAFEYIDLNPYAHWVNSLGYVIGFYFLCHYVWDVPVTATETKKGTIQGLLVVHTLLFILTNYALQIQVFIQPLGKKQDDHYKKYLERIKSMISAGSIISFIVLLPLSLSRDDVTQKTAILVCAIAIPAVFQYLKLLSYIKQEYKVYRNLFQPLLIIFMWLFIIGPIGIGFPILSNMYESSSEEFAIFAQIAVAYSISVIILTVTFASTFYTVLLKNEELEMKKKEVLKQVIQLLANRQVEASEQVCSLIFMRYIHIQSQDPQKLKVELKEGTIVNVIKYSGEEKEKFTLKLVSKEDYDVYNLIERERQRQLSQRGKSIGKSDTETIDSKTQIETLPEQISNPGFFNQLQDLLYDFLCCNYGLQQLSDLVEQEKQKKAEKIWLEQWKAKRLQGEIYKHPTEQFIIRLQSNDFYRYLEKHIDRAERFWCSIHAKFSENFEIILEVLGFIQDENILSHYNIKWNDTFSIKISLIDFAQFMKDNTPINESKYQYLWQLAIKFYPIFLYNFPDLKQQYFSRIKIKGSPFCQEKYEEENCNNKQINKQLQIIQGNYEEYLKQEYQQRQKIIEQRQMQKTPSPLKLKVWETCEFIHLWLWVKPQEIANKFVDNVLGSLGSQLNKIKPEEAKVERNKQWEEMSQEVGDLLISLCQAIDKQMKSQKYVFNLTLTNGLAVVFKFFDFYGLATLAFSSQVGWIEEQKFDPITTVDYQAIWSNFNLFFALALIMSIAYIILGIQASKQIEKNTFGYNAQGKVATFSDLSFYISKLISFISGQFIFVMKTYIDALICDYNTYPYKLMRQPSVECMSNLHFMYGALALIGCSLYYPLSTFLQPAFQYSDHSLDLKYKSSYVALFIQAKLLLLGLSSVFSNLEQEAYLYQMLFSSLVMVLLIYAYYRLQPSYIKWFNYIEICFLFLLCYFYFAAFLIMVTKSRLAGGIFLAVCGSITTPYYGYQIYEYYKTNNWNNPPTISIKVMPLEESQNMTQVDM